MSNKGIILEKIWDNPERVFGCAFSGGNPYQQNLIGGEYKEKGKIRLWRSDSGEIMLHYNGGSRQRPDGKPHRVLDYLAEYHLYTSDFNETLRRCADIYGVNLKYSEKEIELYNRQALAAEVAPVLTQALKDNPNGPTAEYLRKRGFREESFKYFGELTDESIAAVKEHLKNNGVKYGYETLKQLLPYYLANNKFNLVIPYFVNGVVKDLGYRYIGQGTPDGGKYRNTSGGTRGNYSPLRIKYNDVVTIVEGQMDAVKAIQSGLTNVIATGGDGVVEGTISLFKHRSITDVIYIPDTVYKNGVKDVDIIKKAINKAVTITDDNGEPLIKGLQVAEIPTPEGANLNVEEYKIDADDYFSTHTPEELISNAVEWWKWEIDDLARVAKDKTIAEFQDEFYSIFKRSQIHPFNGERIKQYIKGKKLFNDCGITPQSLTDIEEFKREREYYNRVQMAQTELNKAVAEGANPVAVNNALATLNNALSTNDRQEWDRQIYSEFQDDLELLKRQPDKITTKWQLGRISSKNEFYQTSNVAFYPADITVFCAATSHGKTMVLQQAVLDLIKTTNKTYLYVSCEENKTQLLTRSLNVYLDIPTSDEDKTNPEGHDVYFIKHTRKDTIKGVLRGDTPTGEYTKYTNRELYKKLERAILEGVENYKKEVAPKLKMVHTDGTAESIAANIKRIIGEFQDKGIEIGGVFIDYMQLLNSATQTFSRTDELKVICKVLKGIAAETGLPIVIAAQLNRTVLVNGIDSITVANIGEGADIERVAHDVYLVWQIDKSVKEITLSGNSKGLGFRSNRIYSQNSLNVNTYHAKEGYMYIEHLKARDDKADGWGLFPFEGERGQILEIDTEKMIEKVQRDESRRKNNRRN